MRKAIFIGNSFIYYGGCVKCGGEFKNDAASPECAEKRKDDRGLFYRLCKQNGLDVSVTDATHGGRILAHFTPNGDGEQYPTAGIDLLGSFDLSSYTDVFISEAGRNNAYFLQDMKKVMERFTNPDVTFYYLIHNALLFRYPGFYSGCHRKKRHKTARQFSVCHTQTPFATDS